MRNSIKRTVVAAVAALGMATAIASTPTPAQAQWHGGFHGGWGGGGFHGGWGGGWRGGGWGEGWRGGWGRPGWGGGWGWRRAAWGPGWGGGWGGGCWNCGWGWGWDPGWAIAAATVPVGVAIAANSAGPYGGSGCWIRRRVWTSGGHYLGRRLVNICS
ncbi:MAG TPA: hypothetical protein VF886_07850 [Roseiarcus sp.]